MRWLALSLAVHALVAAWLLCRRPGDEGVPWHVPTLPAVQSRTEPMTIVQLVDDAPTPRVVRARSGDGGGTRGRAVVTAKPWDDVEVRVEQMGQGHGHGGSGSGHGSGNGNGNGNGLASIATPLVPSPPPPPAVSKARPARLIWPKRDEEVDDEASYFIARVTVDEDGSVVGARMIETRPGAKGERAASAIWTFRYEPALDDDGRPVRTTIEQPFQVR